MSDATHRHKKRGTDAARAYHALVARHIEQLKAAEEAGYARGIDDARAHPETLGLAPASTTKEQT